MTPPYPKVSVIILNYNNAQLTIRCVQTFATLDYPNFDLLVVDNGSTDDSTNLFQSHLPDVPLICTGMNKGYSSGNNRGIEYALAHGAAYVLIANNDTEVINRGFLNSITGEVQCDPSVGIIGPKVLNPGGRLQETILYNPTLINVAKSQFLRTFSKYDYNVAQDVDAVSGVCLLIRAEVIKMVGLLDEDYFMYGEEQDYCFRVRRSGWRIRYLPVESVLHKNERNNPRGARLRYVYSRRNLVLFLRKHFGLLHGLVLAMLLMGTSVFRVLLALLKLGTSQEHNAEYLKPLAIEFTSVLTKKAATDCRK